MKICQIVASHGSGGLEKHVLDLCRGLARTEHVTLVAPPPLGAALAPGVRFAAVDFRRARYHPGLLWQITRLLRAERFDIIHAHAAKAASLVSSLRAWIPGRTLGTIHNNKPRRAPNFRQLDHVIAVSAGVARTLPRDRPGSIIYHGVQVAPPRRPLSKAEVCARWDLDPGLPLLCALGRLVPAKGFDRLITALAQTTANLVIAGDGPERERLQQQLDQLGLARRLRLLGHRDDIPDLLAGVDGVVVTSRNEGFSYATVEALLHRKPLVATAVPVADEILPPHLLMPDDPAAIAAKLRQVLADPAAWQQDMAPVFARAQSQFSLETMWQQTLDVYQALLTTPAKTPHRP